MNTMYTKRMVMALSLCCSAVVLVACGSSSSNVASATNDLPTPGETTTEPAAPSFSWSGTPRNQSVTVSGIGQTVGVRITNPDSSNESITVSEAVSGDASYTATYGANDHATAAVVKAGGVTLEGLMPDHPETITIAGKNFSVDEFEDGTDGGAGIEMANPYSAGWDYQTFGFWNSAQDSSGELLDGAISVGLQTEGAHIPTTGTATYEGFAFGKGVVNGACLDVVSEMRAQADFANRSIAFSTTNTLVELDTDGATFSRNSSLDMTGTLHHAASTNAITGTVNTAGGLSGTVNARFYGPNAEEIGGTFALGSGNNAYSGGFGGGKQ